MLRPDVKLVGRTRLTQMVFSDYDAVCEQIKLDLQDSGRVSLALDVWTSPQSVAYLGVLTYWVNSQYQLQERLIGFVPLSIDHSGRSQCQEVLKLLEVFQLRQKLFGVVTDNAGSNNTLKEELERALSRVNSQWDRAENSLSCLAHVVNLVTQDFIKAIGSEATNDRIAHELGEDQVRDIGTGLSSVVKKVMHKGNAS